MRFTPEDVRAWMLEGEGRRLEFKRGLPRPERTARVLCAFANTNGGILLIGVTDRGEAWGLRNPGRIVDQLRAIGREVVEPPIELVLGAVELDEGAVICCSVALSGERPHRVLRSDGVEEVVVRVGSSNRAADAATRHALVQRPSTSSLSELERRVLDWVTAHTARGPDANAGATVAAFAKAQNIGRQRARRAFVKLEREGRIVGHGPGTGRVFGTP